MMSLPALPPWDSLHPLVIHFPIALLLVAPLFLIAGALLAPERGRPYLVTALVLMGLGTAGTWMAVATGKAAVEVTGQGAVVDTVIEHHEELAKTTRSVFTALTLVFATILILPAFIGHDRARLFSTTLPLLFLLAYGAGSILLANTASQGGKLVHELGVSAAVEPAVTASSSARPSTTSAN